MRLVLFGVFLLIASCRRPSKQLAATLTPRDSTNQSAIKQSATDIADYSRYLKAGDEQVAMGSEPSWSLTINSSKGLIRFKSTNGDSISTSIPERLADSDGSFQYTAQTESGPLKILFKPDSCVDKRSGQRFDYRVEVDVRGKSYLGCGVSLRQLALLQDIWVLTTLQGRSITASGPNNQLPRLEISLTEERVTGTTGCNRLSGKVRADTRQIQFGPVMTTKMACLSETGRLEGDFLEVLSQLLTYQVAEGKLTLLRDGKPVMTFKKVD